jgi:hypothetical protein
VNLEEYHTLFLVVTLGLILVAASPMLSLVVPEVSSERFSEFWLLGPDHMADGYPFSVGVGEEYTAFVGVANHMSASEYYIVYVKFGNGTEYLTDVDGGMASSLSPLYEFRFFVGDGEAWESSVTFGFEDVVVEDDVLSVGEIVVDGVSFPVDVSAVWESEDNGYFLHLFFELWRYDNELDGFRFDDRFVGLWLNMTGS